MSLKTCIHRLSSKPSLKPSAVLKQSQRPSSKTFSSQSSSFHQQYEPCHDRSNNRPFDKILIANRGEIACRVIRTARRMGVKTVALYSEADGRSSLHASMADEKYKVGIGPTPAESYLRAQEILDIAIKSDCQAIHPGYGFLSENSHFASIVTKKGLIFIGPPASAIQAMGSKAESKALMIQAQVPTTPGYNGENQDAHFLLDQAKHLVGFPLLIKATKGGGGKGMRVVWNEPDFLSALESCRRESLGAFGDTDVILEKYLQHLRHIEIQIMVDNYNNAVYLHERDCSLQRRHQKLLEEAPASDLPLDIRRIMGEMAIKAAQAVGYRNAGTVEFLLDTQCSTPTFYFCEMNTRLQVEHPVTEMITGLDLVEWQLRIAAGEPLPIRNQADIPCVGHAMEARIYAENPLNHFLPSTGNVWHHHPPVTPNVGAQGLARVDTGIRSHQDITLYYDPMISKLIVHGRDREACRQELIKNLNRYQIAGVSSNIPFLIQCARHDSFKQAGVINTGFLELHADEIIQKCHRKLSLFEQSICALVVLLVIENRVMKNGIELSSSMKYPWSNFSGSWRIGGVEGRHRRILQPYMHPDEDSDLSSNPLVILECLSNRDGSFDIRTTDKSHDTSTRTIISPEMNTSDGSSISEYQLQGTLLENGKLEVTMNDCKRFQSSVAWKEDTEKGKISVHVWPDNELDGDSYGMDFDHPLPVGLFTSWKFTNQSSSLQASSSSPNGSGPVTRKVIKSPMPGRVTKIYVNVNDSVSTNQVLIVIEAMKMEHAIKSPMNGHLSQLNTRIGSIVNDGDVVAIVDE